MILPVFARAVAAGMAAFLRALGTPITLDVEVRADLHGAACYAKIALCSEAISYGKSLLTTRRLNSVVRAAKAGLTPLLLL